jgi:hypothetical protein
MASAMIVSCWQARLGIACILPLLLGTTGCSVTRTGDGGSEGPYLAPGPLPATGGPGTEVSPALPPSWSAPTPRWGEGHPAPGGDGAASALPAGLVASGGLARLPGARLSGTGPVQALVVPVSLGGRAPARNEGALVRDVFGASGRGPGATLAQALESASGGRFRLSVVPVSPLVDTRSNDDLTDAGRLRALAQATMREWSRQVDLAYFDNDGADGVPGTADDDGAIDLFIVSVEGERAIASVTLREGFAVSSPTRRAELSTGPVHVLGITREGGDALAPALGLVLDALGLDAGERFFPNGFPRMVSTIARVRLGWISARVVPVGGAVAGVKEGEALLLPLADLAPGTGFWMVENDGRHTYATRAVRTASGHYAATEVKLWERGSELLLPLSRQLGVLGPRAVIGGTAAAPALAWVGVDALPAERMAGEPPLTARW